MIALSALFICSLLHAVTSQSATDPLTNVTQAFNQAQIVPNVVPSFAPALLANLTFTDATTMQQISIIPGSLLAEDQTMNEPTFSLVANTSIQISNIPYVMALVDPDAPTPQNASMAQFLHFLGGDFAGTTSGDVTPLTNSSAALMDFVSPAPPAGSDPHRYVFLVYLQPANFDSQAQTLVNSTTSRSNFNISAFASATGLGNPIAGNFFFVGPGNGTAASTNASASTTGTTPTPTGSAARKNGSFSIVSILIGFGIIYLMSA